ncbi:MAG: hypothetical protein Q8L05_07240, partial [Actinomycetota bacterium]|nr:hypothetical protein [Actinomycetota bacterium]
MQGHSISDSYDTELRRVVDRLRSMPINRLEASQSIVEMLAKELLDCSRTLGSPAPATVPTLNTWAYGDVIMVLGTDLRNDAPTEEGLVSGLNALTLARQ